MRMSDWSSDVCSSDLANALLAPQSIALIGASSDPKKNTSRPLRFMQQHGYTGAIYPINPSSTEILGVKAYPSVDRKSVVQGKSVSVRVDLGGRRILNKNSNNITQ